MAGDPLSVPERAGSWGLGFLPYLGSGPRRLGANEKVPYIVVRNSRIWSFSPNILSANIY